MPVKIQSFGGQAGWAARKVAPAFASWAYTKAIFSFRRRKTLDYINGFLSTETVKKPLVVNIETINRCNGSCSFCPCNTKVEMRPLKQMTDELFLSIVEQLAAWNYSECVVLSLNNEPFMDAHIVERAKTAREKLPDAYLCLITNGTFLSLDKFKDIAPFLDEINLNNYSANMRLHDNIDEIAAYVKAHPDEFRHLVVDIQYRYLNEVLSNRNGASPNKPVKSSAKPIREPCLEPYTSMAIYPDGVIGLCCFDALEHTAIGNCTEKTLEEIWCSEKFGRIRELMRKERSNYEFCRYCDGFSKVIRTKLRGVESL